MKWGCRGVAAQQPELLIVDEVTDLRERHLDLFDGARGIRDQGLLESAVGMPSASIGGEFVHRSVFAMAAACPLGCARGAAPAPPPFLLPSIAPR
jgi:hypothetical protein